MKPITKQLAIAAFILALVTVMSFGIRRVRFSAYRADSGQSTTSARSSESENQSQSGQPLGADTESDHYSVDSYTFDDEHDSQYTNASDWEEVEPSDDYAEAHTDSVKQDKAVSMAKSFKGDYAKSKGSKGLQKISLGDYEDLYLTGEGEFWYVSKQPDGKTTKMQVQIDETTGEITVVDSGDYAKSEGSQDPHRIPMGDNEDLYITGEGEAWYVSEQPDGPSSKTQVQIDEDTGEITPIDSSKNE